LWICVKKWIFDGKFLKNFDFLREFVKKFDFTGKFLQNVNFFRAISHKNFNFPGKNYRIIFFHLKISVYPDKIGQLQVLPGNLFYFSSKLTTF